MEKNNGSSNSTKVLMILCIILASAIIAAAIIIPMSINENQKKLNANQEMSSVIDNLRNSIEKSKAEDGYVVYLVSGNTDAYIQKGERLQESKYVETNLKEEYKLLKARIKYYKTLADVNYKINCEQYATAKKMLDSINNSKSYIEHDWQNALYESIDFCMCIKLNQERVEKLMYDLMKENGVTKTYKEIDKDYLYIYPSEPYGICGELTVSDYYESSGLGDFIINTAEKGDVIYGLMKAKNYFEETRNGSVYAAFVFTGAGGYKSRYYKYENRITSPNGDYRDF